MYRRKRDMVTPYNRFSRDGRVLYNPQCYNGAKVMSWVPEANTLLFANIFWNALLFSMFAYEFNLGKSLFYAGATVLTVGLWVME